MVNFAQSGAKLRDLKVPLKIMKTVTEMTINFTWGHRQRHYFPSDIWWCTGEQNCDCT